MVEARCSNCGALVSPNAKHCGYCGCFFSGKHETDSKTIRSLDEMHRYRRRKRSIERINDISWLEMVIGTLIGIACSIGLTIRLTTLPSIGIGAVLTVLGVILAILFFLCAFATIMCFCFLWRRTDLSPYDTESKYYFCRFQGMVGWCLIGLTIAMSIRLWNSDLVLTQLFWWIGTISVVMLLLVGIAILIRFSLTRDSIEIGGLTESAIIFVLIGILVACLAVRHTVLGPFGLGWVFRLVGLLALIITSLLCIPGVIVYFLFVRPSHGMNPDRTASEQVSRARWLRIAGWMAVIGLLGLGIFLWPIERFSLTSTTWWAGVICLSAVLFAGLVFGIFLICAFLYAIVRELLHPFTTTPESQTAKKNPQPIRRDPRTHTENNESTGSPQS